jgi:hypothetical protein
MWLLEHCSYQAQLSLPLPLREIRWIDKVLQLISVTFGEVVTLANHNSCFLRKTADEDHENTALNDCYVSQLSIITTKTAGRSQKLNKKLG